MKTEPLRETRRRNFIAALEALRIIRRDLGQSMGWSDGALIGHFVNGLRPITEEMARRLEEKLGIPDKSLDIPTERFMLINFSVASSPHRHAARSQAASIERLAGELHFRAKPLTPAKLGQVAKAVAEAAAEKDGPVPVATVKEILREHG